MVTMIRSIRDWYRRPSKSTLGEYVKTFIIILPIAFVIRTFFYGLYQVPTGSMEVTMLVGERFFADKFTVLFSSPKRGDIITFNDPTFTYSDNSVVKLFQQYVWGPSNWTKRVIGVPGDHVRGVIEDGKSVIYINDKKIEEPYINPYPLVAVYKDGSFKFKSWDSQKSFEDQIFYTMDPFTVKRAARILNQFGEESVLQSYAPVFHDGRNMDEYDIKLGSQQYWVLGDNRRGSNDARYWGYPLDAKFIHGKIIWRLISIDSDNSWILVDMILHPIDFWKRVRWNRFFQRVV